MLGLNKPVAQWHSLSLREGKLAERLWHPHAQNITVQNFFPVVLVAACDSSRRPSGSSHLIISTSSSPLTKSSRGPLQILFPFNANSGQHRVEAEFEITADRPYRFTAYRHIGVGLGDVVIELGSQLLDNGELLVEQSLTNHTDQLVSFTCSLFAPERRRIRRQVLHVPRGTHITTYRIENGAELIGKMLWLRADEVRGDRSLNYHMRVAE